MVFGVSFWSQSTSHNDNSNEQQTSPSSREGSFIPQRPSTTTHEAALTPAAEKLQEAQEAPISATTLPTKPAQKTLESSIATMPDTMNCSQAFDLAMGCGGIGGSFNSVYRFGKWRDCSQQWADWRFCMRMRGYPDNEHKKQRIREHYWAKEQRVREQGSSEDVWQEREEKTSGYFQRDPDADGILDGLWARAPPEIEEKERAG